MSTTQWLPRSDAVISCWYFWLLQVELAVAVPNGMTLQPPVVVLASGT
jgi:hypothetical protein